MPNSMLVTCDLRVLCSMLHGGLPSLRARLPLTQQARGHRLHAAAADTVATQLEAAPTEQRQQTAQPKQQKQQQNSAKGGGSSEAGRITPKSEDFGRLVVRGLACKARPDSACQTVVAASVVLQHVKAACTCGPLLP